VSYLVKFFSLQDAKQVRRRRQPPSCIPSPNTLLLPRSLPPGAPGAERVAPVGPRRVHHAPPPRPLRAQDRQEAPRAAGELAPRAGGQARVADPPPPQGLGAPRCARVGLVRRLRRVRAERRPAAVGAGERRGWRGRGRRSVPWVLLRRERARAKQRTMVSSAAGAGCFARGLSGGDPPNPPYCRRGRP
jgi:hypothetical protein